jgi:hypothetical protein
MPCFSFYLLSFFFYKIGRQAGRTGSAWGEELARVREERWCEEGRKMNMVQIMYTHV